MAECSIIGIVASCRMQLPSGPSKMTLTLK